MSLKISIVGAAGYAGLELVRLLSAHPEVEIINLLGKRTAGQKMSDVYPHLMDCCDLEIVEKDLQQVADESDVVFLALPHGVSGGLKLEGCKVIDLAGDFRLGKEGRKEFYGNESSTEYVYGLPELNREAIMGADKVANPGCFATVAQLCLLPFAKVNSVDISAVTGSSGSGKDASDSTHHPLRSHNMKSYKIGKHRHIPEIIQSTGCKEITFVPTSGPFVRGIHCTAFVDAEMVDFKEFYKGHPFVRIKDSVQLVDVVGSNYCDISVQQVGDKIVVQGVIDNLVKGAAGSAVQNFNLMNGFDESLGLTIFPLYP